MTCARGLHLLFGSLGTLARPVCTHDAEAAMCSIVNHDSRCTEGRVGVPDGGSGSSRGSTGPVSNGSPCLWRERERGAGRHPHIWCPTGARKRSYLVGDRPVSTACTLPAGASSGLPGCQRLVPATTGRELVRQEHDGWAYISQREARRTNKSRLARLWGRV